jgi:hypothetical protein
VYSFPDLPEGPWTLRAEKLGFATATQEIVAATDVLGAPFELQMLPRDRMVGIVSTAGFSRADLTGPGAPQSPVPALEVTSELEQRAADGFLINGSALNGAASTWSQAPTFGNARKGGRPLHTYALALTDSNSVLDAANYSLTGQHTLKPPFNNLTGTVSFAGPLKIPWLLPHNGPALTVNYSRIENRASSVYTGLLPSAAERSGQFSQTIYDPQNGSPFPGNAIPSRVSKAANKVVVPLRL